MKYTNKKLYAEYFDLKKCFDKMVLINIMAGLWDSGIKGRIYRNIYKVNQKAVIRIKTAVGNTEEIEIGEILKQGSVIASTVAAHHTDEATRKKHTGVYYGNIKVPMLLFQDDIIKLDECPENLQISTILLQEFQHLNRMMFHETKTKVTINT